jgi:nitroreductase
MQMKALSQALGQSFDEERIKKSLDDPAYNPLLRGEEILVARLYEQLSLAIAFMILQAKHEGVGSCIVGAFANEVTAVNEELYEEVRRDLKIPQDAMILTLVTLGYPAENPKPRPRKSFEGVVSLEKYENPFPTSL